MKQKAGMCYPALYEENIWVIKSHLLNRGKGRISHLLYFWILQNLFCKSTQSGKQDIFPFLHRRNTPNCKQSLKLLRLEAGTAQHDSKSDSRKAPLQRIVTSLPFLSCINKVTDVHELAPFFCLQCSKRSSFCKSKGYSHQKGPINNNNNSAVNCSKQFPYMKLLSSFNSPLR